LDNVKDVPHIGGGLNDHGIALTQVLLGPLSKLAHLDPAGWQHPFLISVHASSNHVFLVNVQGNIAVGACLKSEAEGQKKTFFGYALVA
jgi:hypothetical protein